MPAAACWVHRVRRLEQQVLNADADVVRLARGAVVIRPC